MPSLSAPAIYRLIGILIIALCLCASVQVFGETTGSPGASQSASKSAPQDDDQDEQGVDFENPDTYIDVSEALRNKQYVHRAILSTTIKHTSHFSFERVYLNHLLGFSSVWQKTSPVVKYTTALQGISAGYVTKNGHGVELGFEFSAVSNILLNYKYTIETDAVYGLWPYVGAGVGYEIVALRLANGPPEAGRYTGNMGMGHGVLGLLIPLVDVGFKAEIRVNFYAMDRLVFTQGVGAIIFL